ncbi:MAG: hypothetical protein FJ225_05085 [Lentisphaerae bacterium]|nr:hypothetical protein [Lentisphaerota bacterium]
MKQTPALDAARRQMRPGAIVRDGFLGADRRPLVDILDADDAAVKRLGYTHAALAGRMRELRAAGARGLGEAVCVPPHFEVRVDSVRGKLPCPFGHPGLYPKTNITVKNLAQGGRAITYTDLGIHMIEEHGFYEGRGARFRADPAELARILEPPRA